MVYNQWVQKMLNAAEPSRKPILEEQLARLYNVDAPAKSIFRGCTTNPPLSWQAVQSDPNFWSGWVDDLIRDNPDLGLKELVWLMYKEVVKRGAEMYMPIFEASKGRFGWISGQLDPRLFTESGQMIHDAGELSALSPNTTVCFTLPQILASANAAMEGIKIAEQNGVDLSRWRAVITMMIVRLTEQKALDDQAQRRNIQLSWQDKHWFGIAVFRRAYRILTEAGYARKMLACSMRVGPLVAGKMRFWDVQKLAGGDIVYTCPPYVLEPLFELGDDLIFRSEIEAEVPAQVMDKLSKIPFCIQAYDPNGLALEQFNDHPSTVSTVEAFSKGFTGLEGFIHDRMAACH